MESAHRPRSLRRALKNSPWLVMAICVHAAAIAVTSVIYVTSRNKEIERDPGTISVRSSRIQEPTFQIPEEQPIERRSVPENKLAEIVPETEFIDQLFPEEPPDLANVDLTQEIGDPNSLDTFSSLPTASTSIGVGPEGGVRGSGVSPFSNVRGTGEQYVTKNGRPPLATPQGTQEAVFYGLCWLLRHQNDDGSWTSDSVARNCTEDGCANTDVRVSPHFDEGLTALGVLAFLGAGFGNDSKQLMVDRVRAKRHVLGDDVTNALKWLRQRQHEDGSFTAGDPFLYNEALATLALSEAYGMSGNRYWRVPAQRAVDFLVRAQKASPNGTGRWGWRYHPRPEIPSSGEIPADVALELSDADSSVTTWVVMALKSAQLAGLDVPREALDGALAFTRWASADDGRVGYLDPAQAGAKVAGAGDRFTYHTACMSALGMCTRIFTAHDPKDPFLDKAAVQLIADLPSVSKDRLSVDYYYWYYGSLALNQLDGPESPRRTGKLWPKWNKAVVDALLELQDQREKHCSHGGWLAPDRWSLAAGPVYATALNVLTLEVYYRYPNAFGAKSELGVQAQAK